MLEANIKFIERRRIITTYSFLFGFGVKVDTRDRLVDLESERQRH